MGTIKEEMRKLNNLSMQYKTGKITKEEVIEGVKKIDTSESIVLDVAADVIVRSDM